MRLWEIPDFLNKKVRLASWPKSDYIFYYDGYWRQYLIAQQFNNIAWLFECDNWEVYEELPKTVTLYRYTFKSGDDISQSRWSSETFENYTCNHLHKPILFKTETKEVGLD